LIRDNRREERQKEGIDEENGRVKRKDRERERREGEDGDRNERAMRDYGTILRGKEGAREKKMKVKTVD
jgi:hypothetical protein